MTVERINHWASVQPDKTALIHNDRPLTYRQFASAIGAAHRRLADQGLAEGSTAIVLAQDLANAWLLVMAARSLGLTTVAVTSLGGIDGLRLRDVTCVLAAESERSIAVGLTPPGARPIFVPIGAPGGGATAPDGRWGDHILYTSGTTGGYKKVLVEARLEARRNQARAELSRFSPQSVFHALDFGLWTGIGFKSPSAAWWAGGCVVIDQSPQRFARFFDHGVTYCQTLPETLRTLVAAHPDRQATDGLLLRVGGGFTPLALAEQAIRRLSKRLVIGFSATELTAQVMASEFRTVDDLNWLKPNPGRVVQVVDEDDAVVAPGVEGVLRIQLDELDSRSYLDDEATTTQVFRGGFFYSGDIAVARDDGAVRILGRAADVINIKGQKRAVGPMEERIQQGLGVDEVCLFSGLDADGVEELVVAVRSAAPLDKADVERRLGGSVIFDKVRIELFDDFPRTANGKTRRLELRRMVFAH